MLNGIIGYSDCNGDIRCFKSNGILIFLFKASHLTTLVACLFVFYYKDFGFWLTLKIHVTLFSNDFVNVFSNQLLLHMVLGNRLIDIRSFCRPNI